MMLIPCPWCGPRPRVEFSHAGPDPATRPRPADDAPLAAWTAHVYDRPAAAAPGPRGELWRHTAGCRQWFVVDRDPATQAIAASRPLSGSDAPRERGS